MPRRWALCLFAGLTLLLVVGLASNHAPTRRVVTADRPRPVGQLSLERIVRDFVASIPRRGTEAYDVPTPIEVQAFTDAVEEARAGRLPQARRALDPLAYDLVEGEDRRTGRRLLVLQERRQQDGDWPHGWGLYVFASGSPDGLVVQVPHPLFDIDSFELGLAAFQRSDASALFVAGAHRYANRDGSSDVAHSEGTMFQQVTRSLVGADTTLLQFHGFADDSFPGYGSVVVSDGLAPPSSVSRAVVDLLRARGFDACLYDGTECAGLGATTNVQGRFAQTVGAEFLHVEVIRRLRDDPKARARLAQHTVDAIGRHDDGLG
jgi:hypothetical protein